MAEESRRIGAGAIAAIVGVGVLLIFVFQNTEDVRFDFLFVNFTWPMWLYTLVVAALGALAWVGVSALRKRRSHSR
jgi:uncharacterized integral membrane protein